MMIQTTTKKLKAFPLYMGGSGCDYHRIKLPFLYGCNYIDQKSHEGFKPEKLGDYLANSEVAIYNRHFPLGIEWINNIRNKHGLKVIVDLDDWVNLPTYHPQYRHYKEEAAKMIIESVRNADCVTVTTDRLYQKVKEYNPNTHVLPNALPYGHDQFVPKTLNTDYCPFNFVYAGQSSHLEDVRLMHADINRANKLDVSFTLAGYSSKSPTVWNAIEKVFSVHRNYRRLESLPLTEYMKVYDEADCSLVPLCLNDFNSCKSNLKFLEAGAKKIPVISSWVPPYRDDIDAPVLWVKQQGDWFKHMKYLSENRNAAKEMGEALHEYVKDKYDLFKWNKVRFQLYQQVADGR
jgi:glycosyltransferase involved in cell wall biosynthesis